MKKLISEDNAMYNVQRQQSGNTARQDSKGETAPQPNSVAGLLAANKRDDNSQAPTLKPYPLNLTDEVLSDMFVSNMNLQKMIINAANNPALKRKYRENLNTIYLKLKNINDLAVDISRELDKII